MRSKLFWTSTKILSALYILIFLSRVQGEFPRSGNATPMMANGMYACEFLINS